MVEPGHEDDTREAVGKEQRGTAEGMDDGDAAAVGFGISGIGEGKVLLGRVGPRDDRELRYLHLLWEPGRAERTAAAAAAAGVSSKLGKITGSRIRRQHRMVRNLCPTGKDIYGNMAVASFLFVVREH